MTDERHSIEVKFDNLTTSQKDALLMLFAMMAADGNAGHSEIIAFDVDGDGSFRPVITIDDKPIKVFVAEYVSRQSTQNSAFYTGKRIKSDTFISPDILLMIQECNNNGDKYLLSVDNDDGFAAKAYWVSDDSEYEIGDIVTLSIGSDILIPPGYKHVIDIPNDILTDWQQKYFEEIRKINPR